MLIDAFEARPARFDSALAAIHLDGCGNATVTNGKAKARTGTFLEVVNWKKGYLRLSGNDVLEAKTGWKVPESVPVEEL